MNEIAVVTEQDIPDILRRIHEMYSELPKKEWFSLVIFFFKQKTAYEIGQ